MGKFDNGSLWGIAEQSHIATLNNLFLSLSPHLTLPTSISHTHTEREREK